MKADEGERNWDDEAVEIFVRVRPRLLAIAHRYLPGTSEAEDIVQETWLRWQHTDRTAVVDPQALLATMTTRLAINVTQSARRRRESPRPSLATERTDPDDDPATSAEHRDALEQAVLVILESLTPRERAAFVLREAFDYPYPRLSQFLHLGTANTRQLVCRSRRRIGAERRGGVTSAERQRFLRGFLDAARGGQLDDLERLLTADLVA
jgi:RNA polymerase sigma factor (sigma-70 family)